MTETTSFAQIRLECLKLAIEAYGKGLPNDTHAITQAAEIFYQFAVRQTQMRKMPVFDCSYPYGASPPLSSIGTIRT